MESGGFTPTGIFWIVSGEYIKVSVEGCLETIHLLKLGNLLDEVVSEETKFVAQSFSNNAVVYFWDFSWVPSVAIEAGKLRNTQNGYIFDQYTVFRFWFVTGMEFPPGYDLLDIYAPGIPTKTIGAYHYIFARTDVETVMVRMTLPTAEIYKGVALYDA